MTEAKTNFPVHPRTLPGAKGAGFLKYLPGLIKDPLETLSNISNRYGKIIPFTLAGEELYFVNDPCIIQHILKTNYTNYQRRNSLIDILPLLGNGLLTSGHEYWAEQRKILNGAFHSKLLETYIPEIQKQTSGLIEKWSGMATEKQPVDIQSEMKRLMLGILIRTMFSADVRYDADVIINSLDVITQQASIRKHTLKILHRRLLVPLGFPKLKNDKFLAALKTLDDFVYSMIEDALGGKINARGLLEIMALEYQNGNTDRSKIRDEVMNFLFAGFDTVAVTLTWAFYLLATHPEADEKLRAELKSVLKNSKPGFSNVSDLVYTKRIIDETLRLYPAAWAIFRITEKDDVFDDLKLPARSYLMISPYTLHRNPKAWENPGRFNPDRFEKIRPQDLPMMGYIPFGDGPHVCIGKKLAVLQAQIIIGMISAKFKFSPFPGKKPQIEPGIIIKAKNKIWLKPEIVPGRGK